MSRARTHYPYIISSPAGRGAARPERGASMWSARYAGLYLSRFNLLVHVLNLLVVGRSAGVEMTREQVATAPGRTAPGVQNSGTSMTADFDVPICSDQRFTCIGVQAAFADVDQDTCSSEQVDVFVAGVGEGPAGCFRIPTILSVNETLLVFVERRFLSCGDESPHSIELRRSTDSGRTWLPQQLLDTVGAECKTTACNVAKNGTVSNGAGVVDESTGTLYFAYRKTSVAPAGFWTYMVSSTDVGATWTSPMNKGLSKTGTSPGQGAGVQLGSGRLVLPNNGGGSIYSDTHGATWKDGSNWAPPGMDGHTDYGETQIAMLSDGKTLLNIGHGNRKQERYQIFSQSTNGGATWGKVYRRPELVNVGCQQSMISHTEGDRHFLYYVAPRGLLLDLSEFDEVTQRRDGVVYCSQDDGQTWWLLEPAVIRPGPFMYSGIVHRATNESHVTLGFIFESYVNETKACEPWCSPSSPGLIGEPATDLSIAYAQRTYALPKF